MPLYDRSIKILLFLLVIGVWGLLLRPYFPTPVAQAQKAVSRAQTPKLEKSYGVLLLDPDIGWNVNNKGISSVVTNGLIHGLRQLPSGGWKLHSVVQGANGNGYTIIVEH